MGGSIGREVGLVLVLGELKENGFNLRDRHLRCAFRASVLLRGRRIGTRIVPSVPREDVHVQERMWLLLVRRGLVHLDGRPFRKVRQRAENRAYYSRR